MAQKREWRRLQPVGVGREVRLPGCNKTHRLKPAPLRQRCPLAYVFSVGGRICAHSHEHPRLGWLLLLLLFRPIPSVSQVRPRIADRTADVKQMYDAGRWGEVVDATPDLSADSADLQMYRGLALAKLERWDGARETFAAGATRYPHDPRFLVELGGIAYREKAFSRAEQNLRRALAIQPEDNYANNFLASIYFLDGNLEAALKYWNLTGRPKLADLTFDPQPKLMPLVLDRAVRFSPDREWRRDDFLRTEGQLDALGLYPRATYDLQAQADGSFNLIVRAPEKNDWGNAKLEGALSLLRGLPYQSVYPEFYNLGRKGVNWRSFFRWDDQKRRVSSELAAPVALNPAIRYRIYFDARDENWNITNTLAPTVPAPAGLNLEKAAAGAEIRFIPSGTWGWNAGVEYSYRRFRDVVAIPAGASSFFTNGSSLALGAGVKRSLVRFPERRFTVDSSASGDIGTFFQNPLGRYGRVQGGLTATWYPKARSDDYEVQASLKGGKTFGLVPFDELFTLGFDRDTDLLLRGHPGLVNGQKGNAPLGRNFVLANSEADKILYRNGLLTVRVGPLLDTGRAYDPSGFFGTRNWLWDTGAQAKIRVLGSFQFVLGYGKDLRTGDSSFFTRVSQ
jgi:tetratricopeptide (TPR) repeat protein